MRALPIIAISTLMLTSGAFAQNNSSLPSNQHDRLDEAKRNLADLERARLLHALKDSNLRLQAQSKELEKGSQQQETDATQKNEEMPHPEWFKEPNTYRPCQWDMCTSPPPQ